MLPVAVVQHEPSVPPGSITEVLEDSRLDHFVLDAWATAIWPTARELGALVVMGGTMNVDEVDRYPFLRASRELMTDALERRLPTLGVCLGAQMMARVLGGDVFRAHPRNAFFSKLAFTDAAAGDSVIRSFSDEQVLQFHEDTFTLPPGATLLATSEATRLPQAFRHGELAYAMQFHFEADAAMLRRWCRDTGSRAMIEDWGISEADLLAQASRHIESQDRAGRRLFHRFLELAEATTPVFD